MIVFLKSLAKKVWQASAPVVKQYAQEAALKIGTKILQSAIDWLRKALTPQTQTA